jgi:hypothetical protein
MVASPAVVDAPAINSDASITVTDRRPTPSSSTVDRRITRARKGIEEATFSEANKTPNFEFSGGGGEGRETNLDEIAWLVANLKETITQQTHIVEDLKRSN